MASKTWLYTSIDFYSNSQYLQERIQLWPTYHIKGEKLSKAINKALSQKEWKMLYIWKETRLTMNCRQYCQFWMNRVYIVLIRISFETHSLLIYISLYTVFCIRLHIDFWCNDRCNHKWSHCWFYWSKRGIELESNLITHHKLTAFSVLCFLCFGG